MRADYIDADVEEPNGFIFLKPKIDNTYKVKASIPNIDAKKCYKCYKCIDFCEFNALAIAQDEIIVFDKLCHSCGGCKLICEKGAIKYKDKIVGSIEKGHSYNIKCRRGVLKVGEAIASLLIKELLTNLNSKINIIDAAPGTSCNVLTTLESADYAILVTEPTEFGIHDLKRAIALVLKFKIPFGVIINRVYKRDNLIKRYCKKKKIVILSEISYDKKIAKLYANGKLLIDNDDYKHIFINLSNYLKEYLLCK